MEEDAAIVLPKLRPMKDRLKWDPCMKSITKLTKENEEGSKSDVHDNVKCHYLS
jgi:hypothetical protein